MPYTRKETAVQLRQAGHSIKAISQRINAAQSSVSLWVRNVALTKEQIATLRANTHSPEVIERRRQSRLRNELKKRNVVIDAAKNEIDAISERELWLIGVALYWAEGGKSHSVVRFSNGDPRMIRLMLRFFKEICCVPGEKIKGHIHIHEHLNVHAAERYWQDTTNLPKEQFYKTYNKPNKSSKGTRNSLPYGVCDLYIMDAKLLLKIRGWTEGISNVINEKGQPMPQQQNDQPAD